MNKNVIYYLAFSHCLGIGPVRFALLLKHFGDIKTAYNAPLPMLQELIHNQTVIEQFATFRDTFNPEETLAAITKKQITVITQEDKRFPQQLRDIPDPPICLYVKGAIDIDNQFFAIVGTRKASAYGWQIAKKFAFELAEAGWIIVSGMALGVDTAAHQAVLDAGHNTIAFLGCGVDIVYPPQNQSLYEKITQQGAVVSEFPPGETVKPGLFVARNRLISGLARGVLVIEGTKDSGALITGRYAAEQGKDVFAPPVPLTSTLAEAPNILLKQGAKLVTCTQDILEEYGMKYNLKTELIDGLSKDEKLLIFLLQTEPQTVDDLALKSKVSVHQLIPMLSVMEIRKIIEKNSEGKYQIK